MGMNMNKTALLPNHTNIGTDRSRHIHIAPVDTLEKYFITAEGCRGFKFHQYRLNLIIIMITSHALLSHEHAHSYQHWNHSQIINIIGTLFLLHLFLKSIKSQKIICINYQDTTVPWLSK